MDEQNNPGGGSAPSEPTAAGMPSTPPATEPVAAEEPVAIPAMPSTSEPAAPAGDQGGAVPSASEPQSQPQADQKCVTCGNSASGGNCVACGQGEITCTCQPNSSQGESAPAV